MTSTKLHGAHGDAERTEPAEPGMGRREFLAAAAATSAVFVLGFWLPRRASAAENTLAHAGAVWAEDPAVPEVNGWIVIEPDDTVTVRIAQTELGQGAWTS